MTFLVIAAVVSGVLTAWVFRLTTDTGALRIAVRQVQGHFLEFRLFFDEPRLIWRAQKDLIRANFRLLRTILPATLILALPMAWLYLRLDEGSLRVGESSLVTVGVVHDGDEVTLDVQPEVAIETPPVHITDSREMVWRIRLMRPTAGRPRIAARPSTSVTSLKVDYPERSRVWILWFVLISFASTWVATRIGGPRRVQFVRLSRPAGGSRPSRR